MAKIEKIQPGQTLYDVRRISGTRSFMSKSQYEYWPVYVTEVNIEEGYIIASWNGNRARKLTERMFAKYRYLPPK